MNFNSPLHMQDSYGPGIRSHGLMDKFADELNDSIHHRNLR